MNPSETISAPVRASCRPDRQVRSQKPPIGFGLMPFLPPIGVNTPSPCPEITSYGNPLVQFFRSGQAGGPVRKAVLRPPEGYKGSTRGSLPRYCRGWERVSGMGPSEAISTPVQPSYQPDRQVRSPKPHIGFGKMSFSPRIRINAPSPRPEITTYGKPLLRFFRSGQAGGAVRNEAGRLPGDTHERTDDKNSETFKEVSIYERNNQEERLP